MNRTHELGRSRERLRRAAEDAERLYRIRMHGYQDGSDRDGPSIADDNRIDGILTLDLPDALGALDRALSEAERYRETLEQIVSLPALWQQSTTWREIAERAIEASG